MITTELFRGQEDEGEEKYGVRCVRLAAIHIVARALCRIRIGRSNIPLYNNIRFQTFMIGMLVD